jgi:transcriptional regulator with XRE-family HTH domain
MMEETEQLLKILRTAVRVLGFTNQEIEDRLGVYHGYLGRLFKGAIQLQFEDVLRIARALDMEPAEIFQLAYPQPLNRATEGAKRLRETLQSLQPQAAAAEAPVPAAPAPTAASALSAAIEQELKRMVQQQFEQLLAGLAKGAGRE